MALKPVVRVQANYSRTAITTHDSFQNFAADMGYGTNNLSSGANYGFNPISRTHTKLEWMYRGSWLVRKAVDCPANDMTRAGIDFESSMDPKEVGILHKAWARLATGPKLNQAIKWGRLYGGCLSVIMIEGADMATPLRMTSIGKGSFKGLLVLDRWMVNADLSDFVTELGPDFGLPRYYTTMTNGSIPGMRIHYSRVVRHEGDDIPYWQRIAENGWTVSVLEQAYDRIIAFDSASTGAAQLVYKAHLRTYKVPGLRELIAAGGSMYQAFLQNMSMIRQSQTNEGLTLIDGDDEIEYHTNGAFSGLSDALMQFGQQLSGAFGIPLVILFGQSPAGLGATGDADVRNYYDRIKSEQMSKLEQPVTKIAAVTYWSEIGCAPPSDFGITFNSLWQQTETEKAANASTISTAVVNAFSAGIIDQGTALSELKQSSHETGIFSNITDADIEEAKLAPPPMPEMGGVDPMGAPAGVNGPGNPPEQAPVPPATPNPASPPPAPVTPQKNGVDVPEGLFRVGGTPDNVHVHVPIDQNVRVNYNTTDDFKESEHKRDHGQFSTMAGSGAATPAKTPAPAKAAAPAPAKTAPTNHASHTAVAHLRPDHTALRNAGRAIYVGNKLKMIDALANEPNAIQTLTDLPLSPSSPRLVKYRDEMVAHMRANAATTPTPAAAPKAVKPAPASKALIQRNPDHVNYFVMGKGGAGKSSEQLKEKVAAVLGADPQQMLNALTAGFPAGSRMQTNITVKSADEVKTYTEIWDEGRISRVFNAKDKTVLHDHFALEPSMQGKGIAAASIGAALPAYKAAGYNKVNVVAGLDAGGYAWAKFGFVPDAAAWQRVVAHVDQKMSFKDITAAHPEHNALNVILSSKDPKAIWALADHPMGRELLEYSVWKGSLDLNDAEQYDKCIAYCNKPKKKA